jgi:glutamine synthetase
MANGNKMFLKKEGLKSTFVIFPELEFFLLDNCL